MFRLTTRLSRPRNLVLLQSASLTVLALGVVLWLAFDSVAVGAVVALGGVVASIAVLQICLFLLLVRAHKINDGLAKFIKTSDRAARLAVARENSQRSGASSLGQGSAAAHDRASIEILIKAVGDLTQAIEQQIYADEQRAQALTVLPRRVEDRLVQAWDDWAESELSSGIERGISE